MKKEITISLIMFFVFILFTALGYFIAPQEIKLNENFEKCKQLGGEYNLTHNFKSGAHYEYCGLEEIIRF